MAGKSSKSKTSKSKKKPTKAKRDPLRPVRFLWRWTKRLLLLGAVLVTALVILYSKVNPPTTHTILSEQLRLGSVKRTWVSLDDVAPVAARSAVAAEDAGFCTHWGFDVTAIRRAMSEGAVRGGSTISQQVVKNVFLWQGRSWVRKALETAITPAVELFWSKRRILEVYLNVAEMDEGVFGIEAAAQRYFGVSADQLTAKQAALIASVLPAPKFRSASRPTAWLKKRAASIMDGAATIRADGRARCFED